MKKNILWICNLVFPEVAKQIGIPISNAGGWLLGASRELKKIDKYDLHIVSPSNCVSEIIECVVDGVHYIVIPNENYTDLYEIIRGKINPCLVHVFGTEMAHSWEIFEVFSPNKVVITIQGLVSECAKYYYADLPQKIIRRKGIYEIITGDTIARQKQRFYERGLREVALIKQAKYIIGRTAWDKNVIKIINPSAIYMECDETLRKSFYNCEWDIHKIERYSIMISQGSSPMKGLHYAIRGLEQVKKKYPNAKIYVAGENLLKHARHGRKWTMSSYAKYVYDLIKLYHLKNDVIFLGNMSEQQMCEQYLKSHVYLCPSTLENSSNSLGEAMLIGTPCVASHVGGTPSILTQHIDGYLYTYNSVEDMARCIENIFENDSNAIQVSQSARKHAEITHSPQKNMQQLLAHYEYILGENSI